MKIVKTYEQFNEIDPYNEEIWDDNKSNLQFLYDHLLQWLDAFRPMLIDIIKIGNRKKNSRKNI